MNADWKIIAATLGIFAAGLIAGVATFKLGEHARRAPFPMMREFGPRTGGGPWAERFGREGGMMRGFGDRHWDGEGERGGPVPNPEFERQMAEYRAKLKAVLDPYQAKIDAVLTPDQKRKLDEVRARRFGPPRPGDAGGGVEPEGGLRFVGMIIYKPVLERIAREVGLDAAQQARLDAVFLERRAALLQFLDANPPPTIRMALGSGGGPGAPGGVPPAPTR